MLRETLHNAKHAISTVVESLDGDALEGEDAARLAEELSAISRLCSAGLTICAGRLAAVRYHEHAGHKNAESFLSELSGTPIRDARAVLDTASALADLPGLDQALRSGELSAHQAVEVARGAGDDSSSVTRLLETARSGSLRDLKEEADLLEAARRSREEDEARHRRIHRQRHLRTWSDTSGAFCGRFALTPEDGALLLSGVEAEANLLFDLARRAGIHEPREAHLADALVALTSGQASAGRPEAGAARSGSAGPHGAALPRSDGPPDGATRPGSAAPHDAAPHGSDAPLDNAARPWSAGQPLGNTWSGSAAPNGAGRQESVAPPGSGVGPSRSAAPSGSATSPDVAVEHGTGGEGSLSCNNGPPRPRGRPDATILFHVDLEALRRGTLSAGKECTLEGVGHVPLSLIESYLQSARLWIVVKDGHDIASVISCKRTIPAALQTALAARDRTCVVPGCSSRFHLEIDHIDEFAKGGETKLANLCRICRMHHAMKTNDGYRIEGGPGRWRWVAPRRDSRGSPDRADASIRSDHATGVDASTNAAPMQVGVSGSCDDRSTLEQGRLVPM